jgi:hypothetical protein
MESACATRLNVDIVVAKLAAGLKAWLSREYLFARKNDPGTAGGIEG